MAVQNNPNFSWPMPSKYLPKRRNMNKYCRCHRDSRHKTKDCFELKEEIEILIRQAQLKKYVKGRDQQCNLDW